MEAGNPLSESRKNLIWLCIALVLLIGIAVAAFMSGYGAYTDTVLYDERLEQMREVTEQLFSGLEDAVRTQWYNADIQTNRLIVQNPKTAEQLLAFMKDQAVLSKFSQLHSELIAVDNRGRYYSQNGAQGLLAEMEILSDRPEQISFVSSSTTKERTQMFFLRRLENPIQIQDGNHTVELIYSGVARDMTELNQYFSCKAYEGKNAVYVLDENGAKLFSGQNGSEFLEGYNAYNVLRNLNYLHGSTFEETLNELEQSGMSYSNAILDGEECYYALYQMENAAWVLLFIVPSNSVAVNTVSLVRSTTTLVMVFAILMIVICGACIYWIVRSQQRQALQVAQENNAILEANNQKLQEAQDVTRKALQTAELASKAKSDFLANMSHDIRTPMNAIMGMTTLIKHNVNAPDKVTEYIGKIELSSHHLLNLINDVLDMSKIESGKTELNSGAFNLNDVLTQLDAAFRPQTDEKNQTLIIQTPKFVCPYLIGDNVRLMQVLNNILSNAVKYTPNGGTIRMDIEENPRDTHKYDQLIFRVTDNGIGMSEEFQKHIFESFSREESSVTNSIQGTGLGMAIVKNIVDLMGGTVRVESEQGKGSMFEVALEFKVANAPEQSAEQRQAAEQNAEISLEGMKFLCAEDNALNAEILSELLQMEGASCKIYENGQAISEAFETVKPNEYDFILMDVQMPVMNGYEATKAIRNGKNPLGKTIPIFAMTANAFSEDIQHSLDAGMNGHISKPVDMERLKETIRNFRAGGGKR